MKFLKTFLIVATLTVAFGVAAQVNPFDIEFPIAELGDCESIGDCKTYCDEPSNLDACIDFSENRGLIDEKDAEIARKMIDQTGPGDCQGQEECDTFCSQPENYATCIDFSVEEGFMSQTEADSILQFIQSDDFRGHEESRGSRDPDEPDIDEEKAKELIATVGGPGDCATFDECADYCEDEINQDECFDFAKEHDLFSEEEFADMEKIKKLERKVEEFGGPGDCRGETECQDFCSDSANFEECVTFAVEEGMMDPEIVKDMLKQFIDVEKYDSIESEFLIPKEPTFDEINGFPPQQDFFESEDNFNLSPEFKEEFKQQFDREFQPDFLPQGEPISGEPISGWEEQFNQEFSAPGGPALGWEEEFNQEFNKQFKEQFEDFQPIDNNFIPPNGLLPTVLAPFLELFK